MELIWDINNKDVQKVKALIKRMKNNPLVAQRRKNLKKKIDTVDKHLFWYRLVACLLTTQQRSGPESPISKFLRLEPFPLSLNNCSNHDNLEEFIHSTLSSYDGIRRYNRITEEIVHNFTLIDSEKWSNIKLTLEKLAHDHTHLEEQKAAEKVQSLFKGFGPKQSRNLLQSLNLSVYEIPIDSRITKWLNNFGFPIKLSSKILSDNDNYNLISSGIQKLCAKVGIYPCILDAAIFASFDGDKWEETNIIW